MSTRSGAVFSPYQDSQAILAHIPFNVELQLRKDHEVREHASQGNPDDYYIDPEDDEDCEPNDEKKTETSPVITNSATQDAIEFAHLKGRARLKRLRRKKARMDMKTQDPFRLPFATSIKRVAKKRRSQSKPVVTKVFIKNAKSTSSGWLGHPKPLPASSGQDVESLLEKEGFAYVDWDGYSTHPVVDQVDGIVIGVLAGQPTELGWKGAVTRFADDMRNVREKISAGGKGKETRRGKFYSDTVGIGFGNGRKCASNFRQDSIKSELYRALCDTSALRIAHFQASVFATYAPRVHEYYRSNMQSLLDHNPHLHHNFPRSTFAACTFNLGPRTTTLPHVDRSNLAWGWCAITALGNFNADLGGHLVLWDLGLVIRFPAGATILIPSALLTHSNIPIAEGEERFSFTQFTSGCLLRYVHNGFCTDKEFLEKATKEQLQNREDERASRWSKGLAMLSKVAEFV
ncbi:hypothetical protein H0H93_012239 [Arthromyces matolae]|nr:hypothetical protein H0H93_012239 [Arthromyces matolae]